MSETLKRNATEDEVEYFAFLDETRAEGSTNMLGAASLLRDEFGLDKPQARQVLSTWMNNFTGDEITTDTIIKV